MANRLEAAMAKSHTTPCVPLLRWAGSKKRLLPALVQSAPPQFNRYIEPFVGSGVLFLAMTPRQAILGDINSDLVDTYNTLKRNAATVWERASAMSDSADYYYELRAIDATKLNRLDRAARFVYLNRYCFNGVYRTNREGHFNIARGKGHLFIPEKQAFLNFAARLKTADVLCEDFEKVVSHAGDGDFIYLDPPYARRGARNRGEYGVGAFDDDDETRLVAALKQAHRRGAKILLSYSPEQELLKALKGWKVQHLSVMRNVAGFAGDRRSAKEILVSNY